MSITTLWAFVSGHFPLCIFLNMVDYIFHNFLLCCIGCIAVSDVIQRYKAIHFLCLLYSMHRYDTVLKHLLIKGFSCITADTIDTLYVFNALCTFPSVTPNSEAITLYVFPSCNHPFNCFFFLCVESFSDGSF